MYNTYDSHQLITRQQSYNLNKKLLSIHSEDRDVCKWPFSNNFAIECPEVYEKVETIRVVDITMPSLQYTFTNDYQNTKMAFKLYPQNPAAAWYIPLANNVNGEYILEIQEGYYSPEDLANELQNKLNNTVNSYIQSQGAYPPYQNFKVYYNKVNNTMMFGNLEDQFTFLCDQEITYTLCQCDQPTAFPRCSQWGLPWNLGFDKVTYTSTPLLVSNGDSDIVISYLPSTSPDYVFLAAGTGTVPSYYLLAPFTVKLNGDNAIYMEIDKFNYMDELKPYPVNTSGAINNTYGGIVNSAFVKIPITSTPYSYFTDSTMINLNNCGFYIPLIEKISRLKFKFRYHDGRLVDFRDAPFNFTIEINQIRNEINRPYDARVPKFAI
jgi:hypothetical protein